MYAKQKNVHNKLFFVDPTSRLDIFQTIISVCHSNLCKIIKILLSAWDFDMLHIKNISYAGTKFRTLLFLDLTWNVCIAFVQKVINFSPEILIKNSPRSPLLSGHGAPDLGQIIDCAGDACVEHGDRQKWQHKGQHRVHVVEIASQVLEFLFHGTRLLKHGNYNICIFSS